MLISSHTAVHYADSIYIFGGAVSADNIALESETTNNFFKLTRSADILNTLQCSIGTIGEDCLPCGPGYFANDNVCTPCSVGTYSTSVASSSIFTCIPCAINSSNPNPGSTYCMDCPSYSYCPIGSSKLAKRSEILQYHSSQPHDYELQTVYISNIVSNLWLAIGVTTGALALISIISKKVLENIQHFDIFANQH